MFKLNIVTELDCKFRTITANYTANGLIQEITFRNNFEGWENYLELKNPVGLWGNKKTLADETTILNFVINFNSKLAYGLFLSVCLGKATHIQALVLTVDNLDVYGKTTIQ